METITVKKEELLVSYDRIPYIEPWDEPPLPKPMYQAAKGCNHDWRRRRVQSRRQYRFVCLLCGCRCRYVDDFLTSYQTYLKERAD